MVAPFWWLKYTRPLSESLEEMNLSQKDAAEMVDKFQQDFPLVQEWLDNVRTELTEMAVAVEGRAVRGPVGRAPLLADWVTPDNMIGDNIVVGEDIVLGIHAQQVGNLWRYALTKWWYHSPTVIAVFEDDRLEEVA